MVLQFIAVCVFLCILPRAGANSYEVRKFTSLKNSWLGDELIDFHTHQMLKSFTYFPLFCFELRMYTVY